MADIFLSYSRAGSAEGTAVRAGARAVRMECLLGPRAAARGGLPPRHRARAQAGALRDRALVARLGRKRVGDRRGRVRQTAWSSGVGQDRRCRDAAGLQATARRHAGRLAGRRRARGIPAPDPPPAGPHSARTGSDAAASAGAAGASARATATATAAGVRSRPSRPAPSIGGTHGAPGGRVPGQLHSDQHRCGAHSPQSRRRGGLSHCRRLPVVRGISQLRTARHDQCHRVLRVFRLLLRALSRAVPLCGLGPRARPRPAPVPGREPCGGDRLRGQPAILHLLSGPGAVVVPRHRGHAALGQGQ